MGKIDKYGREHDERGRYMPVRRGGIGVGGAVLLGLLGWFLLRGCTESEATDQVFNNEPISLVFQIVEV